MNLAHKAPVLGTVCIGLAANAFMYSGAARAADAMDKPDVLLISVDDMNDWTGFLGGYGGKAHTPNMDRLAKMGVAFTNGHCPSPLCNPSRTAVLTGRMPSATGIYGNSEWWKPNMPNLKTLPMLFKESGYLTIGSGKIFHHTAGANPPSQWHAFHTLVFDESSWMHDDKLNNPWTIVKPTPKEFPYSGVPGFERQFDWGVLPLTEPEYDDSKTVDYAIARMKESRDKPLFLAVGTFRPHLPLYVPQKYFDMYPPDQIVLPEIPKHDLDDIPEAGKRIAASSDKNRKQIAKTGTARVITQAYLASISYADAQIGRLLDALAATPRAKNTIIVLWSDHGFHLGEKNHWNKRTLWEEATRVPFIIVAPGVGPSGQPCARPVNLIDIYPTLASLCGLQAPKKLSGSDLTPLLKNPDAAWEKPSIIEYEKGNVAVRSERYRYIQYKDGSEELYDHKTDSNEWKNLADDPAFAAVKEDHRRWATKKWAEPTLPKKAFEFDPEAFTWKNKKTGKIITDTEK